MYDDAWATLLQLTLILLSLLTAVTVDLSSSLETFTIHSLLTLGLSFDAIVIIAVPTDFPVTTPYNICLTCVKR